MADRKDYNAFMRETLNIKNMREEKRREVSRDGVFKTYKKKLRSTMIGALTAVEDGFE